MEATSARDMLAREVAFLGESQAEAIRRLLRDLALLPEQAEQLVPASAARRAANKWLVLYVGNLLSAGEPVFLPGTRPIWKVPVRVHYERPGTATTIRVDALSGEIVAGENTAETVLKTVQQFITNGPQNPTP